MISATCSTCGTLKICSFGNWSCPTCDKLLEEYNEHWEERDEPKNATESMVARPSMKQMLQEAGLSGEVTELEDTKPFNTVLEPVIDTSNHGPLCICSICWDSRAEKRIRLEAKSWGLDKESVPTMEKEEIASMPTDVQGIRHQAKMEVIESLRAQFIRADMKEAVAVCVAYGSGLCAAKK